MEDMIHDVTEQAPQESTAEINGNAAKESDSGDGEGGTPTRRRGKASTSWMDLGANEWSECKHSGVLKPPRAHYDQVLHWNKNKNNKKKKQQQRRRQQQQ
jgi:hypothetical protein